MSKKKKEKYRQRQSQRQNAPAPAAPPAAPLSSQEPAAVMRSLNFDSMEEKIRGEADLLEQENKARKEEQEIKKAIDTQEVDRRLESLRRQLGLKK